MCVYHHNHVCVCIMCVCMWTGTDECEHFFSANTIKIIRIYMADLVNLVCKSLQWLTSTFSVKFHQPPFLSPLLEKKEWGGLMDWRLFTNDKMVFENLGKKILLFSWSWNVKLVETIKVCGFLFLFFYNQ